MPQTINATAVVSEVEKDGNYSVISLNSVKMGEDGTPTFVAVFRLTSTHPAAALLKEDQIVTLQLCATGGVVLAPAEITTPQQAEVALPTPQKNPKVQEWSGSAAVTDPMLVNANGKDMLKDPQYRTALGLPELPTGPAPTVAEAVPSTRSQYAGDRV